MLPVDVCFFFFQAEDGIRDADVTGVQTCALPIFLAEGVEVRFASDNVRDVFYPYGDADPLEAAWLAAISAHVDDVEALVGGIAGGRSGIAVGDPADLVLVDAVSLEDALARRPAGRTVVRRG